MSHPFDAQSDLGLALLRLRKDAIDYVAERTPSETIDIVAAETLRAVEMRYTLTPKEMVGDYKDTTLAMYYYDLVNDDDDEPR